MALTVLITSPTLGVRRCSTDEADAAWVPFGTWFESTMPGGWKGGGFSLRQRIDQDLGLRLLDEVEFIDEDGETVYEGRIVKLPRSHGDDYLLGVECLGFASTMLDDTAVPYFYVDRELAKWIDMPINRRAAHISAGPIEQWASVSQGGLVWDIPPQQIANNTVAELHRQLPVGLKATLVQYLGNEAGTFTGFEGPTLHGADNDSFSSGNVSASTVTDNTVRTATLSAAKRYLMLRAFMNGGSPVTPASALQRRYTKIGVHSSHGLPRQAITGDLDGYFIDDMLVHALNLACPKLNAAKLANGGLIEHPDLVVGQAADDDLGPVERIVLDLNKYVLYEWGVYKGREFFFRETNADRLCWEARLERGVHLSLEGDDAEHALNGMLVKYTLADGTPRVAGPVGSGMDVESALLGDTSPENTANQHGYQRKWGEQTISFPLAADIYAVTIGAAYLAQAALPARSGDIELVWQCEHPTKGMRPVREVLAGDFIRLSDHPADVPRRIISARNQEDGRQNTVTVGNDLDKVDAILEQLGVVTKVTVG